VTGTGVAFLGPLGTFCEQALRSVPAADLDAALGAPAGELVPAASTTAALDAVRAG